MIEPKRYAGLTIQEIVQKYEGKKMEDPDKDPLIMALVRRICHLEEKYENNEVIQSFLTFKNAMARNFGLK